jgi:hypothetical protein
MRVSILANPEVDASMKSRSTYRSKKNLGVGEDFGLIKQLANWCNTAIKA